MKREVKMSLNYEEVEMFKFISEYLQKQPESIVDDFIKAYNIEHSNEYQEALDAFWNENK